MRLEMFDKDIRPVKPRSKKGSPGVGLYGSNEALVGLMQGRKQEPPQDAVIVCQPQIWK